MENLKGKVIHGENIGFKQGYPTANLSRRVLINKKIANGVYIARTKHKKKYYDSILVIGVPGFKKQKKGKVEIYFFDLKKNIYGQNIQVEPLKKIRPLVFYKDHSKLLARINLDVKEARNYFKLDK